MDDLTPRERALLERVRAAREPTAEDKSRVQARLFAAIASGAAGAAGGTASAAASSAGGAASSAASSAAGAAAGSAITTGGGGGWLAGVVTALAVGGMAAGGGALYLARLGEGGSGAQIELEAPARQAGARDGAPPEGDRAGVPADRSRTEPPGRAGEDEAVGRNGSSLGADHAAPEEAAEAEDEDADGTEDRADSRSGRRGRSRARGARRAQTGSTPRPQPADGPSDLAAEVALLRDADEALQAGEAARSLGLLRVHARRFPESQLWAEREATRVLALCALGRVDEARSKAKDWMARVSASPLRRVIRSSCAYP